MDIKQMLIGALNSKMREVLTQGKTIKIHEGEKIIRRGHSFPVDVYQVEIDDFLDETALLNGESFNFSLNGTLSFWAEHRGGTMMFTTDFWSDNIKAKYDKDSSTFKITNLGEVYPVI
jgi:hypothetical protein